MPAGQDGDNCLTPAQSGAVKKHPRWAEGQRQAHLFGYPVGAEVTGLSFTAGGR